MGEALGLSAWEGWGSVGGGAWGAGAPDATGEELFGGPWDPAEDAAGEPEGPGEHKGTVGPDGDGDDGGAGEGTIRGAVLEPLQILGGGAVAGDEHLGVTEETVVDDGEHGEEGDAGGTEEKDLREIEQGAGEFFRTVRAAPGEGEEDEDDAAAEEKGELHETEEQEGPLMTAKGREWGAGKEEAEKDGGEGEAPEADGGAADGASSSHSSRLTATPSGCMRRWFSARNRANNMRCQHS